MRLVFLTHFNACLAIPNLRGGAEFGEKWHQAALFEKKQVFNSNVFV